MDLLRFGSSQRSRAGLESERAGEGVGPWVGCARHVAVDNDGVCWLGALGVAADDGVPIVSSGGGDLQKDVGGVGEAAGGGGGAEIEEFGSGGIELEEACGYEVGLKLFDVGEGGAFR